MRILYVVSGTYMADGSTKSLLSLMDYMINNGHHIAVICPNENGLYKYLKAKGIDVFNAYYRNSAIPFDLSLSSWIKFLPRYIKWSAINRKAKKKLYEEVRQWAPDIIHENTSFTDIGRYLSLNLKVPYVAHMREYNSGYWVKGLKSMLNDKRVNVVTITKALAKKYLGSSKAKNVTIYDGIIDTNSIRYTAKKKNYILYAGRIEPNKGTDDLISAYINYAECYPDGLSLKIAGDCVWPDFKRKLQVQLSEHGLSEKVEWLGVIKDINNLAYEAAVTVVPSHFEGLGRILPEAMANGSLCIARNTTGSKEQLDNGISLVGREIGLRFDSVSELTDHLVELSNNMIKDSFHMSSDYEKMIKDSQIAVRKFFTNEASGRAFLNFYEQIK